MTMEERLLTDRHSEQLANGSPGCVMPEVESIGTGRLGAVGCDDWQPAVELVPEEGVQSLHASEVQL